MEENNMNKIKFGILFLLVAASIAAVGSAALSNVTLNRSVSAGQIMVDTDQNVAVQITNISKYTNLVKTDADGKVKFDLNEAINNNKSNGFNTDAIFSLGNTSSGVIKIKNNSDVPIGVTMVNDASSGNSMTLIATNNAGNTIGIGSSADFYFTINTSGQAANKTLNAVLRIEGK